MESGSGNPFLTNLCKLDAALGVGIEKLLLRPRNECSLLRQDQVPVQSRSTGEVKVHKLMPDRARGIEIDRMVFHAGSSMAGRPHLQGTKEYLVGLSGALTVSVDDQNWEVTAGDCWPIRGTRNMAIGIAGAVNPPR